MRTFQFILILLALSINLHCFYISKQPVPTLFVNQQFRFDISHNAGQNLDFLLVSGPSFLTLRPNGQLLFAPKNQGSFQSIIQAINALTNANLITLQYVITVLDKSKQIKKQLWILDQENYFTPITTKAIQIQTDSFDFHTPIMTNENIRLKLNTKNHIGPVIWFYENLPSTMMGSKSSGLVRGYVESEGNYMIKVTAIDSSFNLGHIYFFLKFNLTPLSLQQDSYFQQNWRSGFSVEQKKQNAKLLENEIQNLVDAKKSFKSKRNEALSAYKLTTVLKQQNKSIEDGFTQRIKLKNDELQTQQRQIQIIKNDLNSQKSQEDQSRKSLSDRKKKYQSKVEESKKIKSTQQGIVNDLKQTRTEFDSVKGQIFQLQSQIYQQENEIRKIQFQRFLINVTYVTFQKQQIRMRQILEIRKNKEFQYMIKKVQTDNKVRSIEEQVFLAQTNYDFAYSEYKRLSVQYFQHDIESSSLQSQIQLALKDYDHMKKTLNRLKLNYAIAQGAVNTLEVEKEQLRKLWAYALNSQINSNSIILSDTQMIQAQVKLETQQYPFTGCQKIGNFAWAGSGKIKTIGRNWIKLETQETLNYGKCTDLKTNIKGATKLEVGQWVQFSGYFWNGAIQATSITILSLN